MVPALAFFIAALACTDFDRLVGLTGEQAAGDQTPAARPEEGRAAEVSRVVPGLAGFFYDTAGNVVVAVKGGGGATVTRARLQPLFQQELARSRRRHPAADIIVQGAQYTFFELRNWRDRLEARHVLTIPGVAWLDLDEVANRVAVGLEAAGDPGAVRALGRAAGVPAEALDIERTTPYVAQSTLQDQFRPIQGGIQIQRVSGTSRATCTLGFAALWNNQQVFLTAGHCSPNLMGTDSVAQFQPLAPLTAAESAATTAIGREISRYSAACGNSRCAHSDAAIYGVMPAQTWGLGRIAHPGSGCLPGPCSPVILNVSGYWVIDMTRESFVVNDLVSKIGSATGWSQGSVSRTCVDVSPTHGVTYQCQMFANYGANDGDSGSPIVLDIQGGTDSTVTLGGIHSGKSGSNSVFSPWSGIVQDYGSLVVVPQVQDTARPPIPPLPILPADSTYTVEGPNYPRSQLLYYRNIVRISFDDSTSGLTIRNLLARYNGTIIGGIAGPADPEYFIQVPDPGTTIQALDSLVDQLAREPGVRWAAQVYYRTPGKIYWRHPNDGPGAQRQDWSSPTNATRPLLAIRAPLAWGCETGNYGSVRPKVGVVDYVFDVHQRDLIASGAIVEPPDTGTPRPHSKLLDDTTYRSHGTAVAGVLTASGDNGVGTTGVLWQSDLTMYMYSHNDWVYPDLGALLKRDLNDAIASGVRVLVFSHSLGDVGNDAHVRILRDAFKPYLSAGGLLVMATGQTPGQPGLTMTVPQLAMTHDTSLRALHRAVAQLYDSGYANNILFVGGTDDSGNFWPESNYWTAATVLAPATNIMTLANTADFPAGTWTVSGTSWSAPYVAGVAGLLLAMDPTLTASQIKSYIVRGDTQPRLNPQTGQIGPPQPVAGAPERVYQLDAYGALTLLANERSGVPLCGNRVWTTGQAIVAEDSAAHTTETLVTLPERAEIVNAKHGGRRVEVYSFTSGSRAFELQNGQWVTTTDPPTTLDGGTFTSVFQTSHDLDSSVVISSAIAGVFQIRIRDLHTGNETELTTLTESISGWTDSTCYAISAPDTAGFRHCTDYTPTGSASYAGYTLAYSPLGDEIVAGITRRIIQFTGGLGFVVCPGYEGYEQPPYCQDVTYREDPERTVLHLVRIRTGRDSVQWTIAGKDVFWMGVSEDGAQIALGEGSRHDTWTLHWTQTGIQRIGDPSQYESCGVGYRAYRTGTPLRPLIEFSGAACSDLGRGTISPAPPMVP